MENLMDYLYNVASIFIFCMALSLLLISNQKLSQLIMTSRENLKNENTLYEQQEQTEGTNIIPYTKLITSLLGDLPYDVEINNLLILADNYNYMTFPFYSIPFTNYKKMYHYDLYGRIVRVTYLSQSNQ